MNKLLFIAIIGSSSVLGLPSYAATLAVSQGTINLNNFNITSQSNDTKTETKAIAHTFSADSTVDAKFTGALDFVVNNNSVLAKANGTGKTNGTGSEYVGRSTINLTALGNFSVAASQGFSFNFTSSLFLGNKIDDFNTEVASTFGETFFILKDNKDDRDIDFFKLTGNLETNLIGTNNDSFLPTVSNKNNITFSGSLQTDFIGSQETIFVNTTGFYQKTFSEATDFTLFVGTSNRACSQAPRAIDACTKVPESSNSLALILGFVSFGIIARIDKKNRGSF
jgi:hypothetical protein